MASQKKKKLIGAGVALALMAGVTAGGAFITQSSTITDNKFNASKHDPSGPWLDGALKVSGSSMSYIFSGQVAGEEISRPYVIENVGKMETLRVNVGSLITGGDKEWEIARELGVSASRDGEAFTAIGTVADMKFAESFDLAPGEKTTVTLKVNVKDQDSFHKAGLQNGAQTNVDFQFDSLVVPAEPEA